MSHEHIFFRVQHVPGATIEWASAGMRSIAEDDWNTASALVLHNDDGCWMIHGGVDDTTPTDYLPALLEIAYDLLHYDGIVVKIVGKIFYEDGLRDQAGVYTVQPGDQIRIAHAVANLENTGIEGEWKLYTEEEVPTNNIIEKEIIDILSNARQKIITGR